MNRYPPWLVQGLVAWSQAYPEAAFGFSGGIYLGPFGGPDGHPFVLRRTPRQGKRDSVDEPLDYVGVHLGHLKKKDPRYALVPPCAGKRVNYFYGYTGVLYRPNQFAGVHDHIDWIAGPCWQQHPRPST